MDNNRYKLAGGDGAAYGPRFGPIFAEEVSIFKAKSNADYMLLKLEKTFKEGEDEITHLIISPRYQGETVENIRNGECTIGVSLVLPGKLTDLKNGISESNCKYWSIGTSWRVTA